jgi:hypothetical protein
LRRLTAGAVSLGAVTLLGALMVGSSVVAYRHWGSRGESLSDGRRIHKEYDAGGQLTMIAYDAYGRHRPDTWSYFDHGRLVRTEVDRDGDGVLDTWYYYDAEGNVTRTGFSTKHDGVVDAWRYESPDGVLIKIEYSATRDGRITRTEYYEGNVVTRVADSLGVARQ